MNARSCQEVTFHAKTVKQFAKRKAKDEKDDGTRNGARNAFSVF